MGAPRRGRLARASWAWGLLLAQALGAAAQEVQEPALEPQLEQARSAIGLQPDDGVWETSGRWSGPIGSGAFAWVFSADGRFLLDLRGPERRRYAFDGQTLRRNDGSGGPWRVGGAEAERIQLLAHVWSGAWARPASPCTRSSSEVEGELILGLHSGRAAARLTLDDEGRRPTRLLLQESLGGIHHAMTGSAAWYSPPGSGTQERPTLWMPGRVVSTHEDGREVIYEVADARPWAGGEVPFERLPASPSLLQLDPGVGSTLELTLSDEGAWSVAGRLRGRRLSLELIPRCTGLELGRELVAELLPGASPVAGRVGFREPLRVGPLVRSYPTAALVDLSDGSTGSDGRIGWELLAAGVLQLSTTEPQLSLRGPVPGDGRHAWAPVLFDEQRPVLVATGETGAPRLLALIRPGGQSRHFLGSEPLTLVVAGRPLRLAGGADSGEDLPYDGVVALDALGPEVLIDALGRGLARPAPRPEQD